MKPLSAPELKDQGHAASLHLSPLAIAGGPAEGFVHALGTASAMLVIGAGLYLVMRLCWPINNRSVQS